MLEPCPHVDRMRPVPPPAEVCEDCAAIDGTWVHLRQCRVCGRTGCCNSSPNTHATRHYRATGHPIVRAASEGEEWLWCYDCDRELSGGA